MMWTGLIATLAAIPLLFGVGPKWALYAALLTFAICFTTFCLLYDEPVRRAKQRITAQLGGMSAYGINSEEYHRLQSMTVKPTAADRIMSKGPMLMVQMLSGAVGIGLVVWGCVLRLT